MGDEQGQATSMATTWHHGLIARWWANFNLDGPEIAFFRSYVAAGQPALDVGCGSGRLLVPWVSDGLGVDGVDASADMIEACRGAARAAGCEPALYVQPTHRLDLRRRPADETPPPEQARRLGPDGLHYALRHRITAVDLAERSLTREMQAWQWHGDELVAHETHDLVVNVYSSDEIVALLAAVGFTDVRVLGDYHGGAPAELDGFHVFVATAPP